VNELFEYWQEYPPTHVLVAAYLLGGSDRKSGAGKRKTKRGTDNNFDQLAQFAYSAGGAVSAKLPEAYRHGTTGGRADHRNPV
jgi:hypothetical protein